MLLSVGCSHVSEVLTPTLEPTHAPDAAAAGASSFDATAGAAGAGLAPQATPPSLDAGTGQTCLTLRGALYCWGDNQRGQLGLGDTDPRSLPTRVGTLADWLEVTTGASHSCARRADGSVFCFGANEIGQLGNDAVAQSSSSPVPVALAAAAAHVVSEANHVCVITQNAALYCWGENLEGEIGQGAALVNQLPPSQVGTDQDWIAVDTGQGHTCGLRGAGDLYCWGRNSDSELGLGDGALGQIRIPTQVGATTYAAVQAGQNHSCAIQADGALYCWGGNDFGNLGTGDRLSRTSPTQIGDKLDWVALSLDTFHSCAIDAAEHLFCWGRNQEGQLGVGDTDDRLNPSQVPGERFSHIAVGRFHTCALKVDDSVWCTGANDSGQLGLGDTARRSAFTEVASP
jgi:hypothetical protein